MKLWNKLKNSTILQELLFYSSAIIAVGFIIVNSMTQNRLFLIGSAVGIAGIIVYFVLNPSHLTSLFTDKSSKNELRIIVKIILVLALVIILYIAVKDKLPSIDLTSSKIYTLSEETNSVLKLIDQPLEIKYFLSSRIRERETRDEGDFVKKLLVSYKKASKNIQYEEIDPDLRPDLAHKYNVFERNSILLIYKNKKKMISPMEFYDYQSAPGQQQPQQSFVGEKIITSSIKFLLTSEGKTVYFILGHEERYTSDYQEIGYSSLKTKLQDQDRKVEDLKLLEKGSIPEDASLIVIAAPKNDYSQHEITAIDKYIEKSGKFILITDFGIHSNVVDHLLAKYEIQKEQGMLSDDKNYIQQLGQFGPVLDVTYHDITQKIQEKNLLVFVYESSSFKDPNREKNKDLIVLAQTSDNAWNETSKNNKSGSTPEFNSKEEKRGIKSAVILIEKQNAENQKKNKIGIVFSDADMFANGIINASVGNVKLMENSVNYLLDDQILLNIAGKSLDSGKINLTANQIQFIAWFSFVILPFGTLLLIIIMRLLGKKRR